MKNRRNVFSTYCYEFHWNGHGQFGTEEGVELLGCNKKHHGHSTDHNSGKMSLWQQAANIYQSLEMWDDETLVTFYTVVG